MSTSEKLRRSLASQLELGARAYGAGAAERFTDGETVSFAPWHGFFAQRVLELSVGVAMDEPQLLGRGFAWSAAALTARGVSGVDGARAVDALRGSLREDLPEDSWLLVEPHMARAAAVIGEDGDVLERLRADDALHGEALRFLERTLRGQTRDAIEVLLKLQRQGVATRDLFEGVLMAAAHEMGTMWHMGEACVGEEHAATDAVHTAMSVLWHAAPRSPDSGVSVVVGNVAEDRHDIGVRAAACLLELAGCRVACLGADVPADDFRQAAADHDAGVVVIGATMVTHLPRAAEAVTALRAERPGVRIIVGGPAFAMAEGLAEKVGADAMARSPGEAVEQVGAGR